MPATLPTDRRSATARRLVDAVVDWWNRDRRVRPASPSPDRVRDYVQTGVVMRAPLR